MVLELHVQGSAFDLPSFSPVCLAAIAYVGQTVPRDRWVLVAGDFDLALRLNELPALRDGDTCIWGFEHIVEYLQEQGGRRPQRGEASGGDDDKDELGIDWDLDAGLSRQDKADCVAFSSLITANGQALLDLSLYVSSKNYETVTRPLLSTIIPWPLQYLSSPQLRAAAKARTEHLGLSSLDIDSSSEPTSRSIIPESLQVRPKDTVTTALSQAQHSSQFRLDSLVTTYLSPIQDLLGSKKYLLSSTGPSSLDCLVLGYLSPALHLFLPQPWLANTIRAKFPTLCVYVNNLRNECFGSPQDKKRLPWKQSEERANRGAKTTSFLFTNMTESLPLVRCLRNPTTPTLLHQNNTVALAVAAGTSISAIVGYLLFSGAPFPASPPPQHKKPPSLREMGEAGAILSGGFIDLEDVDMQEAKRRRMMSISEDELEGRIPIVEVDVEVDRESDGDR